MNSAIERLLSLRTRDIMTKQVVSVSANQTMCEAAKTLAEHGLSGAPVTDEQGRCVGIISAVDFLRVEADRDNLGAVRGAPEYRVVQSRPNAALCIDTVGEDMVDRHMSRAVQSISVDASMMAAARVMLAEHLHRLPVLDDRGRPLGMISSLDLVAAMVHAVEE